MSVQSICGAPARAEENADNSEHTLQARKAVRQNFLWFIIYR
jgi:hypothetical protein